MNTGKVLLIAALAGLLGGCVTGEQAKQAAIAKLQAKCAAEGKQFVVNNAEAHTHFNVIMQSADAEVEGHCVGPGDPGYAAPAKPNTAT